MDDLDLFGDNDFLESKDQLGIQSIYQKLIENIENLAKEVFFSEKNYDMVELSHGMTSSLIGQNEYLIAILFKREGQLSIDKDTFRLINEVGFISVEYTRESINLMPMFSSILPPEVKLIIEYEHLQDQDLVFLDLLKNIENMFNTDYDYTDMYFKQIIDMLQNEE